jgi:hypothetical protein
VNNNSTDEERFLAVVPPGTERVRPEELNPGDHAYMYNFAPTDPDNYVAMAGVVKSASASEVVFETVFRTIKGDYTVWEEDPREPVGGGRIVSEGDKFLRVESAAQIEVHQHITNVIELWNHKAPVFIAAAAVALKGIDISKESIMKEITPLPLPIQVMIVNRHGEKGLAVPIPGRLLTHSAAFILLAAMLSFLHEHSLHRKYIVLLASGNEGIQFDSGRDWGDVRATRVTDLTMSSPDTKQVS